MHSSEAPRGDEGPKKKLTADEKRELSAKLAKATDLAAEKRLAIQRKRAEQIAREADSLLKDTTEADRLLDDTEDVWDATADAELENSDVAWSEGTRNAVARGVLADLKDYQGPKAGEKTDADYYQEGLDRELAELDDDAWLDELESGMTAADILKADRTDELAAKAAAAQARLDANIASGPDISDEDSFLDDEFFHEGGERIARVDSDFGDGFDMDDFDPIRMPKEDFDLEGGVISVDEALADDSIIDAPRRSLRGRLPQGVSFKGHKSAFASLAKLGVKVNFNGQTLNFKKENSMVDIVSFEEGIPQPTNAGGYETPDLSNGDELQLLKNGSDGVLLRVKLAGRKDLNYKIG